MKKNERKSIMPAALLIPILIILITVIYCAGLKFPKLFHIKHEYSGYTYYSSIFNIGFDESEAIYAFDRILENEPEYKYILDMFYEDGYTIFFDNKFTYAWCSGHLTDADNFSASVSFDRFTGDAVNGMFVNYINDYFSEKIFFHELCHYADHKMGDACRTDEFKKIYAEEYKRSTLAGIRYYLDIREYFAEEAAYYILYKSLDESTYNRYGKYDDAPKTFDYIEKTLSGLKNGDKK